MVKERQPKHDGAPPVINPVDVIRVQQSRIESQFQAALQTLQTIGLTPASYGGEDRDGIKSYLAQLSPWECTSVAPIAVLQATRLNEAGQPISVFVASFHARTGNIEMVELDGQETPKSELNVECSGDKIKYGYGHAQVLISVKNRGDRMPAQYTGTIYDKGLR